MGCIQKKPKHTGKLVQMISLSKMQHSLNGSNTSISKHIEDMIQRSTSSDAKTAKRIDKTKTSSDINFIKACLKVSTLFNTLNEEEMLKVSESMVLLQVNQDETIIEQGKPGHMYFIISQGAVEVVIDNKRISILKQGDAFGELALIQNSLRTSSIIALTDTLLWTITRSDFNSLLTSITISNFNENKEFISKIPVFADISDHQLNSLVASLVQMKFPPNSKIVGINQKGDSMFIVKEGTASCVVRGEERRRINKGDYFGEISILNSAPRNATVFALNETTCLMISKQMLNTVFEGEFYKILYNNLIFESLKRQKYFGILNSKQLKSLATEFQIVRIKDDVAIQRGTDLSSRIWILLKGDFRKGGVLIEKYSYFGIEEVILSNKIELDDHIVADGECDYGVINAKEIDQILEGDFKSVEESNQLCQIILNLPYLNECSLDLIYHIARQKTSKCYEAGEIVYEKDNLITKIFILKSGKILVKTGDKSEKLDQGTVLGFTEMITEELTPSSIICEENCEFCIFQKEDFEKVIDSELLHKMKERMKFKLIKKDLGDLKILEKLSYDGSRLDFRSNFSENFDLRITSIPKFHIKKNLKKYIVQELEVMKKLDHFFIPQFLCYTKTDMGLLIYRENIPGPEFLEHLEKQSQPFEYLFKFYFACLVEIVSYLYENSVILKNMVPESFIVGPDGYLYLSDLSFSAIIQERCNTVLGNPYYVSPEAISEKGYNGTSMFWTLGVILYEMICKEVPFGQGDNNPYSIYEKVMRKRLIFNTLSDKFIESKRIIEQLLCKSPNLRMIGGPLKFKLQSYFSCIDWMNLKVKKIKPPIYPAITKKSVSAEIIELFPKSNDEFDVDWDLGF